MKKILVLILTIGCNYLAFCQMIDGKLDKKIIVQFLKENGEIVDEINKNDYYYDYLYSRKMLHIHNKKYTYYVIGLSSDHNRKYIVLLKEKELIFFPTKNFDNEIKKIFYYLKNKQINIKTDKLIIFIEELKDVYDYNNNKSLK